MYEFIKQTPKPEPPRQCGMGAFHQAIQVFYELNLDREINGMIEALELFNIKEGTLVNISQKDQFEKNGKIIHVIPAHEYLLK